MSLIRRIVPSCTGSPAPQEIITTLMAKLAGGFTYVPYLPPLCARRKYSALSKCEPGVDTFSLPQSGIYTLTVEGRIYDNDASGNYAFQLVPNPSGTATALSSRSLPDLIVAAVSVSPPSGLQSGGLATVQWTDENVGTGPTVGSFTDRSPSAMAPTWSWPIRSCPIPSLTPAMAPWRPMRSGTASLRCNCLTEPTASARCRSPSRSTRRTALPRAIPPTIPRTPPSTVTLAPYPDLLVESLRAMPATGWLPSSLVTLDWRLTNSGAAFANSNWTDSILVLNTNSRRHHSDHDHQL